MGGESICAQLTELGAPDRPVDLLQAPPAPADRPRGQGHRHEAPGCPDLHQELRRLRGSEGLARRPWKGLDDLEIATAEWVNWFNSRRTLKHCDDLTPVEAEQAHYVHHQTPATAGVSN